MHATRYVGSWELGAGSWELGAGSWELGAGDRAPGATCWGCQPDGGGRMSVPFVIVDFRVFAPTACPEKVPKLCAAKYIGITVYIINIY